MTRDVGKKLRNTYKKAKLANPASFQAKTCGSYHFQNRNSALHYRHTQENRRSELDQAYSRCIADGQWQQSRCVAASSNGLGKKSTEAMAR